MAYTPLTYDQFVTGYSNLAKTSEQNALNEKLRTNTQGLQNTTSQLNQNRTGINNAYTSGLEKITNATNKQLPTYTSNANQIDAQTRQAAARLSEIMASRGLLRSGGALTQQSNIYAQGNAGLAQNLRDKSDFMANQAASANELAANQAYGLSDIDRQMALAQLQAQQNEQAYREQYANNLTAAPLQAALNYPELYAAQTEQAANLLATLLNYNLETGKQTGAISIPKGFTYGDSMINLLNQLGLMAST